MSVALKQCVLDPMLVKPKCCSYFEKCKQIAEKVNRFLKIEKKLLPLKSKCIYTLTTWGQIYTISVLQSFAFDNFQSEHPAVRIKETAKKVYLFSAMKLQFLICF